MKKAVTDLRNLSKVLDAENISKIGLPATIRFAIELLGKSGLCNTQFLQTGVEQKLESSREIVVYRFVQEAVNNIIKHSGATETVIEMIYGETALDLKITDNGVGFVPEYEKNVAADKTGAGLYNMKKRAALVGGQLKITSEPGHGTEIAIHIPYLLKNTYL